VKVYDTLRFLFDDGANFEGHHYAFHVWGAEFDAIFRRVSGSGSRLLTDPRAVRFAAGTVRVHPRQAQ
jgi:hypothetical protein